MRRGSASKWETFRLDQVENSNAWLENCLYCIFICNLFVNHVLKPISNYYLIIATSCGDKLKNFVSYWYIFSTGRTVTILLCLTFPVSSCISSPLCSCLSSYVCVCVWAGTLPVFTLWFLPSSSAWQLLIAPPVNSPVPHHSTSAFNLQILIISFTVTLFSHALCSISSWFVSDVLARYSLVHSCCTLWRLTHILCVLRITSISLDWSRLCAHCFLCHAIHCSAPWLIQKLKNTTAPQ